MNFASAAKNLHSIKASASFCAELRVFSQESLCGVNQWLIVCAPVSAVMTRPSSPFHTPAPGI